MCISKRLAGFALCFAVFAMAVCLLPGVSYAAAPYHIGIMTGTVSQSEDELRGAEFAMKKFGDVAKGGMIKHVTYPDNFMSEMETTIAQIVGLADDPLMKVIIVNQAIPGTTEGFRRVKAKRPDILCLAGEPQEDPNVINSVADLSVIEDFISRGYLIVHTAKKMGATKFVHISFPRHMSYESISRRASIMEQACKDLGMQYVFETAPDPTSDVGVAGAQQFMLEKVPAWVKKYGKDTAFFTTNSSLHEPLLRQLAKYGGYYVEATSASPIVGYPGAFNIDLAKEAGDWPAILKKVEKAVIKAGGKGRMGTWAYSHGYANTLALVYLGKDAVDGKARITSKKDLLESYAHSTPGVKWSANYYTDYGTGVTTKKMVLLYQDTYVFGRGYMGTPNVKVPAKYFKVK